MVDKRDQEIRCRVQGCVKDLLSEWADENGVDLQDVAFQCLLDGVKIRLVKNSTILNAKRLAQLMQL